MKKNLTVIFFILLCTNAMCESMSTSDFLDALETVNTVKIKTYIENDVKVMDPYLKGNYTLTKAEAVEYLLILIENAKVLENKDNKISFMYGKSSIIDLIFKNKQGKLILVEIMIDEISN